MRRHIVIITLFMNLVAISSATVSMGVFESDGTTPFDGRDIMVGTKLTIVVSSDSTDYWSGGLFIGGQNRALAALSARGFDPNTRDSPAVPTKYSVRTEINEFAVLTEPVHEAQNLRI